MKLKKPAKPALEKKVRESILSRFLGRRTDAQGKGPGPDNRASSPLQEPGAGHKKSQGRPPPHEPDGGSRSKHGSGPKPEPNNAGLGSKAPGPEAQKKGVDRQEQVIYTAIDQIIEIVDSKGEIPLQELSKILNIPADRMEELAKILDEHGILQLHYPSNPLAHPLLRSLSKHDFKRLGRQD